MKCIRSFMAILVAAALALTVSACDSNENSGEEVSQEALEEMNVMMTEVFTVLDEIAYELEGNTTTKMGANRQTADQLQPAKANMPRFTCEEGGSVDYEVAESDRKEDWRLTFNGCSGIDGSLDYGFEVSDPESPPFVTEFYMDGELRERCTLRYNDWRQTITVSFDETSQDFAGSIVFNGAISATCGNESFSCRYDDVSVDLSDDATDQVDLHGTYCGQKS